MTIMKKALITGITGQDGSYLSELLREKGYEVHGIIRRSSSFNTGRILHLFNDIHDQDNRFHLHYGDMLDDSTLERLINKIKPHEIYNLAAQSHVRVSFDIPLYSVDVAAMGTIRLLEAIRNCEAEKDVRYYQASSSEMFGAVDQVPQNELTSFHPRSPYACAKVFAHLQTINYRESYGMHASNGILFNHESPRRGETFVTRKITRGIARIIAGKDQKIYLGNLDAKRDWGYAKDYVEAMWLMLQQDQADDYVIATGQTWSVKQFLEKAFSLTDRSWEDHVEIDPRYFRPSEVDILLGDPSKAKSRLNWQSKTGFDELVRIMLKADLELENIENDL